MCGLAGMVAVDPRRRVDRQRVRAMRDTMVHRGPDGHGEWASDDGRVALAHRRLSIIDLSQAASQPMSTPDGRYHIVFNGEIYNHAAIRAKLVACGVGPWRTSHSDTEVILQAYAHWGMDALHQFRGMFAFAIWDETARELLLVRDRMGIKPLYYALHDGVLYFASEIKAILQAGLPRAVNEEAFYHYLTFLTTPEPATLFAGISKLGSGSYMRVERNGQAKLGRWYDAWDHVVPKTEFSRSQLADMLLEELRTAVRLRKESDVPVGVFLSGGIDSSTNTALFSEGEGKIVKTFSVGYDSDYGSYTNELDYARQVADAFKTDHHVIRLSQGDLFSFLPRMIELQDEPIGDPVCVPVYYVSALARQHGVIVAQVGEGSDELFWGYPTWKLKHKLQRWGRMPLSVYAAKAAYTAAGALGRGASHPFEALRRHGSRYPVFWGGVDAFTRAEKNAILNPVLLHRLRGIDSWDALAPLWNHFRAKAWEPSILHWMTYCDLSIRLPELLLMRVDKMGMGASIEGRVPFLDHKLVELALGIPEHQKVLHGELKSLLKLAVRGVIPDTVIDRPKQGFGVPVYEWFLDRLGTYAREVLMEFARESELIRPDSVDALFSCQRGPQLWYLLNVALWWRLYIAQQPIEIPAAA